MKEVLRKDYLDSIDRFRDKKGFVKVITGVRRCGKSTLLRQFTEKLKASGAEKIITMNFETIDFDHIRKYEDLNKFIKENVDPKEHTYLIMDEIQRVAEWERSVNGLLAGYDADIYITGSNAHVLSSELSTFLTGRYVTISMFPLSFSEYYELHSDIEKDESVMFDRYMRYGAFPWVDPFNDDRTIRVMLSDLYGSIAYNDVMYREQIRDRGDLDKVIRFLMINIGNPISSNSIAKSLGGIRRETAERYLKLLEEAYMFYKADRFDLKSTALSPTPKYYSVDTGLRNAPLGYRDEDRGRLMENIVYLELRRRGYIVRIGKYGSGEIDFTATDPNGAVEYFQVTVSMMSDETRARELRPLKVLNDNFPKTVISTDSRLPSVTGEGIKHIHIIDWLLKRA